MDESGATLRAFLLDPHSRRCFDKFFRLCFLTAVAYLRYLEARGFRVRGDFGSLELVITDLAIDLLGSLLQSKPGRPFFHVFDYYRRHNVVDFQNADPEELYSHFTILIRGFIRKELGALRAQENSQLANLKRRFRDILKNEQYNTLKLRGSLSDSIHLQSHQGDLRLDHLPISRQQLTDIVDSAYHQSNNRTEWCFNIFRLIDRLTTHQNVVEQKELLATIIEVNSRYIDIDGLRPAPMPTPSEYAVRSAIAKATDEVLALVKNGLLAGFIEKKRLTTQESRLFLDGVRHYLTDMGESGETDAIPDYYRHVMPQSAHGSYLEKHKYMFEAVMKKAAQELRERLKRVSIIW